MGLIVIKEKGDVYIVDKSIRVGGNVFGSNLNTGNYVSQGIETNAKIDELFKQLIDDIKKNTDKSNQEQLFFFAEQLKDALLQKDQEKSYKLIGFLRKALGDVGSIASIVSFFGLTL